MEDAGGVDAAQELLRRRAVRRDDALRVRAAVGVDVVHRRAPGSFTTSTRNNIEQHKERYRSMTTFRVNDHTD